MKSFLVEIKNELIKYKSNIIKIFFAFYSYISIMRVVGTYNNYNIFFTLVLFAIIFMFLKVNINKETKKISVVTSIIVSLVISVGSIVENSFSENTLNIFNIKVLIELLFIFGGIFIFLYFLFNVFFTKVKTINLLCENERNESNKIFFISWIIILILWLPYFLRFFPGIMTLDSRMQLYYIEDMVFKNNHPFVQTWFEGGIYNFGKFLFGDSNLAMGFYTLIQMLILSAIFAYAIKFLYKHKFNSIIIIIVLFSYALLPQFTLYSVTIWKDVLFGGAMLLLLISIVEMTLSDEFKISNIILFVIAFLMILFFRNNGIYILIICFPFFIYCFKKNIKIILPLLLSLFTLYFVVTGPIYSYLKVEKANAVESLAIPLQQVGRVIASDGNMNKNEKEYLKSIFDFAEIQNVYLPYIVDPVKNHANHDVLTKTKSKFLGTWLSLLFKNPDTYIEAYLSQTLGYWYPSVKYWTTGFVSDDNTYGVHNVNLLPDKFTEIIDRTRLNGYSLSVFCWGIGFGFLLLFLSIIVSIVRKIDKRKYFAWFIPFFGLWLTMMLASPVYAEYRYVYGLFTSLPIIVLLPYIIKSKKYKKINSNTKRKKHNIK